MRVSVDRGRRFVHCVLVRISPVAVLVAVYAYSAIRARGEEMSEVRVVGHLYVDLQRSLSSRAVRSLCEGLPLLALLEIVRAWAATSAKAWRYKVLGPIGRCLLPISAKLCRRDACSDPGLYRVGGAYTTAHVDTAPQVVEIAHQALKRRGASSLWL